MKMKRIKQVFNLIIQTIQRRRRRANVLSGLKRPAWEESFFLDSLDHDFPLGLRDLNRTYQEHQLRPEKKE